MGSFVETFLGTVLLVLWLLVFGRILISWVDPAGRSRLGQFLVQSTEPILAPVRKVIPSTGMFDFSSLLVLVVLGAIWRALLR